MYKKITKKYLDKQIIKQNNMRKNFKERKIFHLKYQNLTVQDPDQLVLAHFRKTIKTVPLILRISPDNVHRRTTFHIKPSYSQQKQQRRCSSVFSSLDEGGEFSDKKFLEPPERITRKKKEKKSSNASIPMSNISSPHFISNTSFFEFFKLRSCQQTQTQTSLILTKKVIDGQKKEEQQQITQPRFEAVKSSQFSIRLKKKQLNSRPKRYRRVPPALTPPPLTRQQLTQFRERITPFINPWQQLQSPLSKQAIIEYTSKLMQKSK